MRSFQRQVELRRLCNQLPVLGKANSLFKLVKCGVFCLFVKLRLSPHCVGPGVTVCACMRFAGVIRSGYLVLANQHTSSEGQGSRDLRQTRVEPY